MNSMSNFPNLQRLRITFLSEQEDLSKEKMLHVPF